MSQDAVSTQTASFWQELETLKSPPPKDVAPVPEAGAPAPSSSKLPLSDGRPTLVVFLRHCGCPFAEKTFRTLATMASKFGDKAHFIAVSHSSQAATDRWVVQVGGSWGADIIVDEDRDIYAQWGLGLTTTWEVLGPSTLYSVFKMGFNEGIWNRPAESGSRWQKSGAFAVDEKGTVRWSHVSVSAADVPDLDAAVRTLGFSLPKPPSTAATAQH